MGAQTVREITDHVFQPTNMLVKYADFDPVEDKYMAISVNYRGEIKSKEANATVQWLKQNNKVSFVEWCPTGFKIGLNEVPAASVEGDKMVRTNFEFLQPSRETRWYGSFLACSSHR